MFSAAQHFLEMRLIRGHVKYLLQVYIYLSAVSRGELIGWKIMVPFYILSIFSHEICFQRSRKENRFNHHIYYTGLCTIWFVLIIAFGRSIEDDFNNNIWEIATSMVNLVLKLIDGDSFVIFIAFIIILAISIAVEFIISKSDQLSNSLRTFRYLFQGKTISNDEDNGIKLNLSPTETVLRDLHGKIVSLEFKSNLIMLLIVIVLISTAIVVIFAGNLAQMDVFSVSVPEQITREVTRIEKMILEDYERSSFRKTDISAEEKVAREKLRDTKLVQLDILQRAHAGALEKQIHIIEKKSSIDHEIITPANFTRLSVLVVLIFLVQILISLYRYNIRLSTFYSSRKSILLLLEGTQKREMDYLEKLLHPTSVDFGREPQHPLDRIFGLFTRSKDKQAAKSASKSTKKPKLREKKPEAKPAPSDA